MLALVLLLGCQGDGSRLLGWGWGLIDFISLPGSGRRVRMKGAGRERCVSLLCSTLDMYMFLDLPALDSESVPGLLPNGLTGLGFRETPLQSGLGGFPGVSA